MADDIISDVNTNDEVVGELKKQQHQQTVERSVEQNPLAIVQSGLNEPLLNMLKLGRTTAIFQGVEKCIKVVDKGSTNQRHCLSMIVSETNRGKVCTRCDRAPVQGHAEPKVINSSMIRLSDKELKELGLEKDPTFVPPEHRKVVPQPVKPIAEKPVREKRAYTRRATKVAPLTNAVRIEVSMKELDSSANIVNVLLQKALEAIYDLPITKFSEAEAIRGTSERIKILLSEQGEVLRGPQ